jgi:pilus assembly protein CpaC
MKAQRGYGLLAWLVAAISMLMLAPGLLLAADNEGTGMSIVLNVGENYIINNLSPGEVPAVKVITNPHALIVHNEGPGKVSVLGAEAGEWTLAVKMADGSKINYDVTVKSVGSVFDINHPGTSPGPIVGSGKSSGMAAAPVVTKLDSGAGPVNPVAAEPAAVTPPATPSSFNFYPSVPAASYSQPPKAPSGPTASAAMSNQRYRSDPSISLMGGERPSGEISGGRHFLPEEGGLQLQTGSSRIIDFNSKLRRVSVADTTVADIQVINPFQVNLIGHKPGFTTMTVWDQKGQYDERTVRVDPNGKQQVLLSTMVAELDRSAIENQGTNLSAALSRAGVSIVGLPGPVATPFSTSAAASETAVQPQSFPTGGNLIGMLVSNSITYGLAAGNKNYQLQGFFQYLENHQLAKLLAQPQLLANSGEEAKFLSGGEIPIVIAQALNSSIVFKQYGTSVEFVPTVVGHNDVELLVKPEVSQPDFALGVSLFGFVVPAFVTRRAETMVQLKDNQTLIIAGLILHQKTTQVYKVPYLGDVPYLGGLFRNTGYNNSETDLVMSVTPQIVRPLPDGASAYNPTSVPDLTPEQVETRRLAQPDASRPRF